MCPDRAAKVIKHDPRNAAGARTMTTRWFERGNRARSLAHMNWQRFGAGRQSDFGPGHSASPDLADRSVFRPLETPEGQLLLVLLTVYPQEPQKRHPQGYPQGPPFFFFFSNRFSFDSENEMRGGECGCG